jgi:hypothetical protein
LGNSVYAEKINKIDQNNVMKGKKIKRMRKADGKSVM